MKLARSFVAVMAIAALTACDDDDPTDPDETNLAGTYTVSSFTYTADTGAPEIDLAGLNICNGGACGITTLTVNADHTFSGTLRLPGEGDIPIAGTLVLTGGNGITIDFTDATTNTGAVEDEMGTFALSGTSNNTLTLTLPDVTFDFGALQGMPGTMTDSNLVIVATRS